MALYNLTLSRELTQPWYESSPWGDSDQHAAYIPCRASASAALPYILAGTHFTYPQGDGRLSLPVECSTAWPSQVSHYGAMPAGQSPIHVLTGLMLAELQWPSVRHLHLVMCLHRGGYFVKLQCIVAYMSLSLPSDGIQWMTGSYDYFMIFLNIFFIFYKFYISLSNYVLYGKWSCVL